MVLAEAMAHLVIEDGGIGVGRNPDVAADRGEVHLGAATSQPEAHQASRRREVLPAALQDFIDGDAVYDDRKLRPVGWRWRARDHRGAACRGQAGEHCDKGLLEHGAIINTP